MNWSQMLSLSFQGVLALFTIGLVIITWGLWRSTKRYVDATKEMADSMKRNTEIMRLEFAQRLRDYHNPKSQSSKFLPQLSTIMLESQNDLDNAMLSSELSQEFENIGFPLSKNASVAVITQNAKWSITDGNETYIIDKQDDKLAILMDIDVIKQKAEQNYGKLLGKWVGNIQKELSQDDTE